MDDSQAASLEQIRALVAANGAVRFAGQRREELYGWVERALVRHQYGTDRETFWYPTTSRHGRRCETDSIRL
jgi:hypothetical protein